MLDHLTAEDASVVIGQEAPVVALPAKGFWSYERIQTLKRMWGEGCSTSLIASEVGCTRNSVAGKVNRLGLAFRLTKKSVEKKQRAPVLRMFRSGPRMVAAKPVHRTVEVSVPTPLNLSLNDLGSMQCHYPYGEGPFVYCGHPVSVKGAPYCCAHMQLCYLERRT